MLLAKLKYGELLWSLQVKTVYAEYLPPSWDRENVKEYFKRFGDIEYVVLAKELPSSRRLDYAFIHYKTRDAALTCIEAIRRERSEGDGSKVLHFVESLLLVYILENKNS